VWPADHDVPIRRCIRRRRRRTRQYGHAAISATGSAVRHTLAYGNAANWQVLENIRKIAATGTKTVVIVNMDKPVILTEFIDDVAGVYGAFGLATPALLDVVFGRRRSRQASFRRAERHALGDGTGRRRAVRHGGSMFKFGFGLTYTR